MSDKPLPIRFEARERIYSLGVTAQLARVTTEFVQECERENLIQITQVHGRKGYGPDTVRRLIRIRHLQRDLGLDLTAIDCILRLRHQIGDLQKQLHDMERRMIEREQELIAEIQRLRKQMARECDWKFM